MDANASFRQRTAAAVTHPATLGAVALFLLNDLVLKPAWPDAWLPGKLSALAFVVFASPLLAFFLSLAVRGSARGARVAFVTAYVGLPLLYAVFTTSPASTPPSSTPSRSRTAVRRSPPSTRRTRS